MRKPLMVGEWPLIGRTAELETIKSVVASGAPGLVLAGSTGTGKSRLALEALRLGEAAGMAPARAAATRSAAAIPLGAFAPLLPPASFARRGGVDDRADLLRRCADALTAVGDGRRLLLVVDDAHLLDDTSATLVHQLVSGGSALVVVTLLTGEFAPDAITALWKDEGVQRIDVGGLRADAVEELLRAALGGPVDGATVAEVMVRSRGNALFLRELVVAALDDGILRDEGGIWRLTGELRLSNRLVELVERRLQHLSERERCLLEVLSFGEPLGAAELTRFADEGLSEGLERKGLVSSRMDDRRLTLWLAHPLYGQVLRDRIPPLRGRSIARMLAEVVEQTGARRREDVLRVASWRLDGGGGDPDRMLAAAATARWRYDFPLAERLCREAVRSGSSFEAKLLAGQLATLQGRGEEAEAKLTSLADVAVDDRQRALVAIARLDNDAFFMGRVEEGLRTAEEAEKVVRPGPWRDEITAKRSSILTGLQGPDTAARLAEPLFERTGGRALVWTSIVLEYSFGRIGRFDDAYRAATVGRRTHDELAEPIEWYPWLHEFFRCEALAHAGRLADALSAATEQYETGLATRSPEAQAFFALHLARVHTEQGLLETAAVRAREAAALFRQLGRPVFIREALSRLTLALASMGDAAGANAALAEVTELAIPPAVFFGADLATATAWAAVAADDVPTGRRQLGEAASLGREIGDRVGEAAALHGLARLGAPEEAVDRLTELAAVIEGQFTAVRAEHAAALVHKDPDRLETVSARFESLGAMLLAAEAMTDAGVGWHRLGQPRRAASADRRAARLVAACESPKSPVLRAAKVLSHITRAERDAALRAAAGKTDKEIAAELHVSVRTVESHLQSVYRKLGLAGRGELRDALQ